MGMCMPATACARCIRESVAPLVVARSDDEAIYLSRGRIAIQFA